MTKDIIDKNYINITTYLYKNYPGLGTPLKYLKLNNRVNSCLGILTVWDRPHIVDLFANFASQLPDDAAADTIAEVIANKLIIIMSWDKLIDGLVDQGNSGSVRKFAFGPNERVWISTAELSGDCRRLILTFKSSTVFSQDKVQVSLLSLARLTDGSTSWKDMTIGIQVRNLDEAVAELDEITMKTFSYQYLADSINKIYR